MNFNDLEARLNRMYHAVGKTTEFELNKYAKPFKEVVQESPGQRTTRIGVDFRGKNEAENQEDFLGAIGSIVSMKDHIKNELKTNGSDPQDFEDWINSHAELCIALDIWNMDKHGSPLTKPPRAGYHPQLIDVRRTLLLSSKGDGVAFSVKELAEGKGGAMIAFAGHIEDENGNLIVGVRELIDSCVEQVEEFLTIRPEFSFTPT